MTVQNNKLVTSTLTFLVLLFISLALINQVVEVGEQSKGETVQNITYAELFLNTPDSVNPVNCTTGDIYDVFDDNTTTYCQKIGGAYYYANFTKPDNSELIAVTKYDGSSWQNCTEFFDNQSRLCDKDPFELRFYTDVNVSVYNCRNGTGSTWWGSANLCDWDYDPDAQALGRIYEVGIYYNTTTTEETVRETNPFWSRIVSLIIIVVLISLLYVVIRWKPSGKRGG